MLRMSMLLLMVMICVFPANAREIDEIPGITVTGHGEAFGTPDIAYVTVGVTTKAEAAAAAAADNARIAQAIMMAVKAVGVAEIDIQTQNYSVQPWMKYGEGPPKQLGYEVRNSLRVIVRDITRVGSVIDAAVKAGANDVQGVAFDIANHRELRNQAIAGAVEDARSKATTIANAMGVKLGSPLGVNESGLRPPMPLFISAEMSAAAATTPISPGQLNVTHDVTIIYAIVP